MFNRFVPFGVFLALVVFVAGCGGSIPATAVPTITLATVQPTVVVATAVEATTVAATTVAISPAAVTTSDAAPTAPAGATTASGTDTITLTLNPAKSEARYRVREQLARLSLPSDAVGKTKSISGQIVAKTDGTIDSANSKFVVDLSTLQSDSGMRDGFVSRNVLGTDQYPNATFVPTKADGLPTSMPADGKFNFKLTGDLTIRDVTKSVTWDVTGTFTGNEGKGTATTSFPFEYFNLSQPQVPVVLSVVNNITLEVDVDLMRAGS